MNKKILSLFIGAVLFSGVAVAEISGPGLKGITQAVADLLYARLASTNTFTKDQKINDPEALAGGTFSGMRLQTTERASYCLGPSDGQTREFCLSGGSTVMLHGSNGDLYDGASTGNVTLQSDSSTNRHWFTPSGSMVVGGGQQPPIEAAFMVGSNLLNAATFVVDTTNDITKHLPISAPAATECDEAAEKGRMYYDSTADAFKYCNGTAWTSFGGGGEGRFKYQGEATPSRSRGERETAAS